MASWLYDSGIELYCREGSSRVVSWCHYVQTSLQPPHPLCRYQANLQVITDAPLDSTPAQSELIWDYCTDYGAAAAVV